MMLDSEGRLLQFQAWPEEMPVDGKSTSEVDFPKLLAAAGFDASKMTAAEPAWVPPSAFDARAAWAGKEGSDPVRVEAAAWQGRVVALKLQFPWKMVAPSDDATIGGFFLLFLPLMAAAVAWRNLRVGRGDKQGANRLAGFLLMCSVTAEFCVAHHVPSGTEVGVLIRALRDSLFLPVMLWLVYVAFEPYLRRYAPSILIAWSRLLEGRWRDPLVGGHLLSGTAIGIGVTLALAQVPVLNPNAGLTLLVDATHSVAWLANEVAIGIGAALLLTLLWLLFRILARRDWLASALMIGAAVAAFVPSFGRAALGVGVVVSVVALIILRFGVLAAVSYYFTCYAAAIGGAPWTTSVSAWYARTALLAIAAILAVAIYGFRTTLAGRPLWRDELQEDGGGRL